MRHEDYTSDTICRAMGLSGFVENSWTESEQPFLRVVLTPSFHPEVCITVAPGANVASLSVVALVDQLWARKADVRSSCDDERVDVTPSAFEEVVGLFQAAHAAFNPNRKFVYIDGMRSESCLVSRAHTRRIRAHVSEQQATDKFVARLVEIAWSGCKHPRVRNALAGAAIYLGIKYSLDPLPERKPVTHLAVFGSPEDRRDFLEMLKKQKKN
jgi:hypothetical protein